MSGPSPSPALRDREVARDARAPVMAAGLAAFAIGNGLGELSLLREARGAVLDWGGAYAQGVRLTGPWRVADRLGGSVEPERYDPGSAIQSYGSFRSSRSNARLRVEEVLVVHPTEPRLLWRRSYSTTSPDPPPIEVEVEFEPMLAPVLLEGIRPDRFRLERVGSTVRVAAGAFALSYDAVPGPGRISANGADWNGARSDGPLRSVAIRHALRIPPGARAELRVLIGGGRRNRHPSGEFSPLVDTWAGLHRAEHERWAAGTPSLEIPEAPDLVQGYELARSALRSLYTCPEPGFQGLVAGYPWYAALWCRDLARMLPAVLWLGDAEWAAASLDTVFAFQAPQRIDALGATAGELPMQVSPGPVFLFGTSDTSLYFPGLVRRYVDQTNDVARAHGWLPALEGVRRWAEAKVDPSVGLFRNGGELAALEDASKDERVRLGVESHDTTIWDSADRRDHAVDLQLRWLELLRDLTALSELPGAPEPWTGLGPAAVELARVLPGRYRWPEEGYLYDSLRSDGAPVRQIRPNALEWVGHGLLDPDEEGRIVARASREDLRAPWGLRTLASTDPSYDPQAYHMGQVWPIATAWLARAALRSSDPSLGAELLRGIARQYGAENGWANECLRGDRPEPFDSCFLLGFSVAPFLNAIFEDLFGLRLDARRGIVELRPVEPRPFARMALRGIRFAGGRLDVGFDPEGAYARWDGPGPIVVAGRGGSLRVDPGSSGRLPASPGDPAPPAAPSAG